MEHDYLKIFHSLPESVQDAILSEGTAQKIKSLCEAVGVSETLMPKVAELIGDVMMGVSREVDLSSKFAEAGLTPVQAEALSHNATVEILAPLHLTHISYSAPRAEEPTAVFPPTPNSIIQAPQPQTELKPSFREAVFTSLSPKAEAAPGEIIHPAPFVLHEENPIEETRPLHQDFSVQRPTFYKPVFSSVEPGFGAYVKPKAATVELGGGEIKKDLPTSLKTSPQQVRVVHYSEFKTDVDPFAAQPTIPTSPTPITAPVVPNPAVAPASQILRTPITPTAPITPIHPSNIVDLKDLPLK